VPQEGEDEEDEAPLEEVKKIQGEAGTEGGTSQQGNGDNRLNSWV
jgi:hypothetical protein